MGGGRHPVDADSDSLEDTVSKLSWPREEIGRSGFKRSKEEESPNFKSEPLHSETDSSDMHAVSAVSHGSLIKHRGRRSIHDVWKNAIEEGRNEIAAEEGNSEALRVSTGTLPKEENDENIEDGAETGKVKDADSDDEVDLELERQRRNGQISSISIAEVEQDSKNHREIVFELEDATSKQLPFLHGLKNDSIEGRRRSAMCLKISQNNCMLKMRYAGIEVEKERLLRYSPGVWLIERGGMNRHDYDIPSVTTLLLVGPKGAGKSTLINNILRVLSKGNERFDRAQVSYNQSTESGSYFLQEYMVPGGSKSFCIFDSRGLSDNVAENLPVLQNWITHGIRHGEMVLRSSDGNGVRMLMEYKARDRHYKRSKIRKVNFVIFVVSALSILEIMDNMETLACDTLVKLFSCPYLSFKDDKPVVVMTHGDELNDSDRIRAHIYLGELLGVSAVDQVFDIADDLNPATDMALLDMLECSLKRADRNLPYKGKDLMHQLGFILKAPIRLPYWPLWTLKVDEVLYCGILAALAILICFKLALSAGSKQHGVEWHQIRHLWLG